MKIKGINPIEQHVEKLVLAVFALFAMAMFVLQFDIFGDPNAVDIGQRKGVAPGQAVDVVRLEAKKLEGLIDDINSEGPQVPDVTGPLAMVNGAFQSPAVDPSLQVIRLAKGEITEPIDRRPPDPGDSTDVAQSFLEVVPPAPIDTTARAFGATINPFVPIEVTALQAFLPADQPLDIRAVSVQASFPAQEFRAAMASVPEIASVRALPRAWWEGVVEILDVEIQREELGPDGSVVGTSIVEPAPGIPSLRARIQAPDITQPDLPEVLGEEDKNREEIRRAPFYDIIAGEPWIWPGLAAERDAADPNRVEIQRLLEERRSINREIEKINDAQKAGGPGDDEEDKGAPPPPPGPSPAGGGRPSGGGRGKETGGAAIAKRIADLKARVTEIETRLKDEFERDVDGLPLTKVAVTDFVEPVTSLTGEGASPIVTVWAHDLKPIPGKVYQYRVRVWVTNPLFANITQLGADQQDAAKAVVIASEWSEPTAPVSIDPSPAFFVASANRGEGIAGAAVMRRAQSASLDVFTFHYGYWRAGEVSIAPGDQIRATISIPSLPRFPIDTNPAGDAVLGEQTPGPETLTFTRDAYLLSVVPASSGDGDLVFLANADGSLAVRLAEADADSPGAELMRESAGKGLEATVLTPTPGGVGRRP